jgi:hypothetical protein
MEPIDGQAVCPTCGRRDTAAALRPLFLVTGASGSGKTSIFGPLASLLNSRCVTFDVDWLLDAAGALSGAESVTEIQWDGFFQAWLSVAHGVAQSGLPTLLLGPVVPDRLLDNPARKWVGEIHSLLLDCPDELRRQRMESRPPWRRRDIDEQTDFGRWLRENIPNQLDTSACSPDRAAETVADWVLTQLAHSQAGQLGGWKTS